MTSKRPFSAVIDIGSTRITALAGEINEEGGMEIIGHAITPSRGIRRGVVLNPEEFSGAVKYLINQLELQTGGRIKVVDAAMAGQGIAVIPHEGLRYTETGMVSQKDVDYLEREAANVPLEPGYKLYHHFPVSYEIGEDSNVAVPVGTVGRKLIARYTLVTAPASYQESVEKALARAGLQLGIFALSPLALAEVVVSDEEKDLGVILVDMGGGTTKVTAFSEGKLVHMAVIPFGGEVITRDIREGCSILQKSAELLKIQYGQAIGDFAEEDKVVTIPGQKGWESKEISFKTLAFIIQARLEEIIDFVCFQIEQSVPRAHSAQGIVLTGGTARMTNLVQLMKVRTGMDSRPGFVPDGISGLPDTDPENCLTALGLLKMSLTSDSNGGQRQFRSGKPRESGAAPTAGNGFFTNLGKKMSQQISMMFEEDDTTM